MSILAYKYCPWNRYTKMLIYDGIMHFSNPLSFNDRYDCQPCGAYNGVLPEDYSWEDRNEAAKRRLLLADIQKRRQQMNQRISQYGVSCFSKSCNIPKMWAHYADRNRGVCLCFDLDELGFKGVYKEVEYKEERKVFDFVRTDIDEDIWFYTKSKDWIEEQEIRYLMRPSFSTGNRIQRNFRYNQNALKEVIFGSEWSFDMWHNEFLSLIDKGIQVEVAFMEQMMDIKTFEYKKANVNYKVSHL